MLDKQEPSANPFSKLKQQVRGDLDDVNNLIMSLFSNQTELIPEISQHTVNAGGKRLRPILTLATAELCGYSGKSHIALAAAVEFIHTATLLHDDVVDASSLRRGIKTANNIWGNKESILVGDFILAKAFKLMGEADSLEVYKCLSDASVIITEGEVLQLENEKNINLTNETYDKIITAKTASLFSAACEVSAIISNVSSLQRNALKDYGLYLGKAFQIIDDTLDYVAVLEKFGKNLGDDFKEGKMTLPAIIAFDKANKLEKQIFMDNFGKGESLTDLNQILEILNKYNAITISIETAKTYTELAAKNLEQLPDSPVRTLLYDLLDYVINRIS